jgi:hypothetical protein
MLLVTVMAPGRALKETVPENMFLKITHREGLLSDL